MPLLVLPECTVREKGYLHFLPRESSWWEGEASKHWKIPRCVPRSLTEAWGNARLALQPLWDIGKSDKDSAAHWLWGETGSNKGNKSLPRRPFWPRCRADVQAVGAQLLLCVHSSYRHCSQPFYTQKEGEHSDVPAMPERGYQLLMALSSQRKLSYSESVSRKTMCRSGAITRWVHASGLRFCHLSSFR